jgi:hypothetical protein
MRLYLECSADEVLAQVAGVPVRAIIHSHGKGKVSKSLAKNSGVTGMVDEDLGSAEPRTLSQYALVSDTHDLKLRIDKSRNNRLVVVCPDLEEWLVKTAKSASVKMADFSLSEDPRALHAEITTRLPNMQRLLRELLERKNPRLLHLKTLLAV